MVGTNPIPSDIPTCDKCGPISIFPLSLSLLHLWESHQSCSPKQERGGREGEREAEGKKKAVEEEGIKTSRQGEGEGEEGSGGGRKDKLPEE